MVTSIAQRRKRRKINSSADDTVSRKLASCGQGSSELEQVHAGVSMSFDHAFNTPTIPKCLK